jgi:hypothetical protein
MTFKVKSVVTPEQLLQMKAIAKTVEALDKVKVIERRGTTTHDGNVPFVMSERDVFLNDKGVKRVIPLKPTKRRNYAHA